MSTMDELKIETIPEPDIRECLESLKGLGWRFSLTPARHLRLEHPETPSAIFCTMDEIRNLGTAVLRQMCQTLDPSGQKRRSDAKDPIGGADLRQASCPYTRLVRRLPCDHGTQTSPAIRTGTGRDGTRRGGVRARSRCTGGSSS